MRLRILSLLFLMCSIAQGSCSSVCCSVLLSFALKSRYFLRVMNSSSLKAAAAEQRQGGEHLLQRTFGELTMPFSKGKLVKPLQLRSTCRVCNDEATGYLYYRGVCCFSCRVFFRRAVVKESVDACPASKNCLVTLATRANCQYCRLQKCYAIGMDPKTVKPRSESKVSTQSIYNG